MAIGTILGLGLLGGQLVASELSKGKQKKAAEKREDAIQREDRKNAIARALGSQPGSARQMPTGIANTSLLDTIGGLSGVGSSLAFRSSTKKPDLGGPNQDFHLLKDNTAINRGLR